MRINLNTQQFSADDTQQMVRVARTARATAAGIIVGAIYLAMVTSMMADTSDRPTAASIPDMQSTDKPASAIDEESSSVAAVTRHG